MSMRKFIIVINLRIYITTSCHDAWLFASIFNADKMVSFEWDGGAIPNLILNRDPFLQDHVFQLLRK